MKPKTSNWGVAVILILSWSLPLYTLAHNQLNPDIGSALGVVYGFFIGSGIHLILPLIWVAIRRSRLKKGHILALLISFGLMVVLAVISDGGALSRTSG